MIKINYLSDLHLELQREKVEDYFDIGGGCDIVVIAGDLTNSRFIEETLTKLANAINPTPLLYVSGNHDYYRSNTMTVSSKLEELSKTISNLCVLSPIRHAIIYDYVFIGCVGWQDNVNYNINNFSRINDFYKIHGHTEKVNSLATMEYDYLKRKINSTEFDGLTKIVVTHIPPSIEAVDWCGEETIRHIDIIEAYHNNWDEITEGVDLWISGHIHDSINTIHSETSCKFVRNALGYKGHKRENIEFDKYKIVEL